MNPEALNGTELGTYTIQQMIGRGGMGVVFLAQQARTQRPVALKVLLPPTSQTIATSEQQSLFLQRFRREMEVVASLEHANILPVHEYGDRDGVAYLVMPYSTGGTLQDVLSKEGQLAWPRLMSYLDLMAAAIDYAQESGVLHRNIKPTNMLLATDGGLAVTDFGLVNIVTGGLTPQDRLLGTAGPFVVPDYMAPEQVTDDAMDRRADLYSLGIVLYQMVTGQTPFQGTTAVYIAAQHVQLPLPSPRSLRADLPPAAEQVMMRAVAKQPADRFATARDFANAFRIALTSAGIVLPATQSNVATKHPLGTLSGGQVITHPVWETGNNEVMRGNRATTLHSTQSTKETQAGISPDQPSTGAIPMWSTRLRSRQKAGALRPSNGMGTIPSMSTGGFSAPSTPLAGELPKVGGGVEAVSAEKPALPEQLSPRATPGALEATGTTDAMSKTGAAGITKVLPEIQQEATGTTSTQPSISSMPNPFSSFSSMGTTGALQVTGEQRATGTTIKLTDPVKIVQVPIAGQPGKYMTGFLPVVPSTEGTGHSAETKPLGNLLTPPKGDAKKRLRIVGIAALAAVVIISSFVALLIHARSNVPAQRSIGAHHIVVTPNMLATAEAQATATVQANIILIDPLSQNIHNWPIVTTGSKLYFFADDAYHIADNDSKQSAPSILAGENISGPMAYTLTMEEIKGNDASLSNSFGMIFRFTTYKKGNQTDTTFYIFEVVNTKGGQYQFWKYDSGKAGLWTSIWKHTFGSEFHWGHGSRSINTVRMFANGKSFSFTVNGKAVGNAQDSSIASGAIGMLVNLRGTEVAFSNLELTHS